MEPRERVLTALRRGVPDCVPKDLELSPAQLDAFRERSGTVDPLAFFGLETRAVNPKSPLNDADFAPYLGDLPSGARVDEWGVAWIRGSLYHFERMVHPLAQITDPAEVEHYPFPHLTEPALFDGYREQVAAYQAAGFAVVGRACALGGTVFWPAYKLRGMERLLMDLLLQPEIASALLDRVTEIMVGFAGKIASMGVDILWLADDFGAQRSLLISPSMWEHWFMARLARVIQAAKEAHPSVLIAFHSDGTIEPLIPHLIEIGVDVLNPVQPECMDPAAIKRSYGDRLAFWGGLGTQTTLPFGTPDEVRQTVRHLVATVGRDGGYLAAPTHVIEPEVPWENILAFVEAVDSYGRY
jgi:uroporphyrinogen decarboxylase